MPIALPTRPASDRRLSFPANHAVLRPPRPRALAGHALGRCAPPVDRFGLDAAGDDLLRIARQWLDTHQRIGALLPGMPEPPHVAQVRVTLTKPPTGLGRP